MFNGVQPQTTHLFCSAIYWLNIQITSNLSANTGVVSGFQLLLGIP
ncbi:hypothetical protein HMPREF0454_04139 [Hafnia alvei ATCC 51873]|uniref:Uncharacterized protein n=1 Tax=Hafnia alvei ATCC 51873 TaxID=1002364 RepID=G9YC14_HAFAL|nr:hypothetical protein HMPREF0454_04139 [Hafnia alvei ATCC 51873]